MNFNEYWEKGGASKLRKRSSSSDVKKAAQSLWNKAIKHGRTDNGFVDMSFPEYWNEEGIGEQIDRKNRWALFFTIDKSAMKEAMREIWDDGVDIGERGSITIGDSNIKWIK